ncbi:MAG: SpoIIE family protein phosphatase [Nitrospirae bacterium]|nr:SpoIIE family protein phosphatase [Nitrospirota bacterium]
MVDGLGHGPEAEKASRRVVDYAADHAAEDLGYILRGAHETLRETRGAAAGFVRVDGEAGEILYLGVGNVELRVRSDRVIRPVASNGILGQEIGRVREERIPYRPGDLIVLHTDGISQRFTLEEIPGIRVVTPSHAAAWIMEHYGKPNDDATILVAR